jgi:hypothetical protein
MQALHAPAAGCFHASFPNTQWDEIECEEPTPLRYVPRTDTPAGISPLTVGAGHDFVAQAPHGHFINAALGQFPEWKNLKSETGGGHPNQYTLQLNTNDDPYSAACDGYPGCFAWQQYVVSSDYYPPGGSGPSGKTEVFIQDWLIDYGYHDGRNICPAGWMDAGQVGTGDQCFRNSKAAVVHNGQIPISDLPDLALEGTANADGTDEVEAFYGSDAYKVYTPDTLTDLAFDWSQVEFNVFGNGGGSGAEFNSGAGLLVEVELDYGSSSAPKCQPPSKVLGTTAETNNLNPGECVAGVGKYPYIEFIEEN